MMMSRALLQTASPSVVALLLQTVLGIVAPLVATWGATEVTKLTTTVSHWPDWEKRILATVYAVCMTGIGHALGITLPEAWGSLAAPQIQAILAAAGAMLLHRILAGPPAPAPPA
jgi:hypothetical protein